MNVQNRIQKVDFKKVFICRNEKTDTQIQISEALISQNILEKEQIWSTHSIQLQNWQSYIK